MPQKKDMGCQKNLTITPAASSLYDTSTLYIETLPHSVESLHIETSRAPRRGVYII